MRGWQFDFRTTGFHDDAEARALRVNEELGGHGLATWLAGRLREQGMDASAPWYEDHGADFGLVHAGKRYLVVCCVGEDGRSERDAMVTIDHQRSLMDRMLGRNRLDGNEAVGAVIGRILSSAPELTGLKQSSID